VLTAGAGTAVSAASKSKYLVSANTALKKIADIVKRRRFNAKQQHPLALDNPKAQKRIDKPAAKLEPLSKSIASVKMKRHDVACFKKNKKGDVDEYDRQIAGQQDGLNKMTVKEYLNNRKSYAEIKRKGTGAAQVKARKDFREKLVKLHKESLSEAGIFGEAAIDKADALAQVDMATLNALHNPDMVAGGYDQKNNKGLDIGDASVNKSIGSQWNTKGNSSNSRVKQMDQKANNALENFGPDTLMNVNLHRCK